MSIATTIVVASVPILTFLGMWQQVSSATLGVHLPTKFLRCNFVYCNLFLHIVTLLSRASGIKSCSVCY